jgi:hypothetical protein
MRRNKTEGKDGACVEKAVGLIGRWMNEQSV